MSSIVWEHEKKKNTDAAADGPLDPVVGYVGCKACGTKTGQKRFRISRSSDELWWAVDQADSGADPEYYLGAYDECVMWCFNRLQENAA